MAAAEQYSVIASGLVSARMLLAAPTGYSIILVPLVGTYSILGSKGRDDQSGMQTTRPATGHSSKHRWMLQYIVPYAQCLHSVPASSCVVADKHVAWSLLPSPTLEMQNAECGNNDLSLHACHHVHRFFLARKMPTAEKS